MKVRNRTVQCMADDPWTSRDYEDIKYLVIHRLDKAGESAEEIAFNFRTFYRLGKYTGFKMPYHFIIGRDGTTEQAVEIQYQAPAQGSFNFRSIGIACIGDFRNHPPTDAQSAHLQELCSLLSQAFPDAEIVRHDELHGASSDRSKICPGKYLHLPSPQPNRGQSPLDAELELLKHGILL